MTSTGQDVQPSAARASALSHAGSVHRVRRASTLRRLLAVTDATAVIAALATAIFVFSTDADGLVRLTWGLAVLPLWTLLFKVYGLYDRDGKRVSHSTVDDVPWLFHAVLIGTLGLWALSGLPLQAGITGSEVPAFFVLALVGIPVARATARALAGVFVAPERVLFVGGGPMARLLVQKIQLHPEYGLSVTGYVGERSPELDESEIGHLGPLANLESVCRTAAIDRLVVVSPSVEESQVAELIRVARGFDVSISILPHLVEVLGPSVEIDDVEGVTVLGMNPPALTPSSRFLKRTMDFTLALVFLVLLLPLMLLIALAVKLTSSGPIFYSQDRIGLEGRRFRMYKFRTMVKDAEARAAALRQQSRHGAWLLLEDDPRITRAGRFLRRASLDELPQLWNVVSGDMSLVGPRPMPPDVDRHISGWGRRRLDLTPGITGLWQVLGRTQIPFEEMVKLDYMYVTNWSLWQDIRLLIRTLPAVMRRRGAN